MYRQTQRFSMSVSSEISLASLSTIFPLLQNDIIGSMQLAAIIRCFIYNADGRFFTTVRMLETRVQQAASIPTPSRGSAAPPAPFK